MSKDTPYPPNRANHSYHQLRLDLDAVGRAYREAERSRRTSAQSMFYLWTDYLGQAWERDFARRAAQ